MKIRTDFVTNSSSACYVIQFQFKGDGGEVATYKIVTRDIGTEYGVSNARREMSMSDRHAKALELRSPEEENGEILIGGRRLSRIEDLDELIEAVLWLASARLYDGDYVNALRLMPGGVEALTDWCTQQGITRDNLRIIGGKIRVDAWGDSLFDTREYIDQWGVNLQRDQLRRTGRVYWRSLDDPDWKPGWQDTVWWPC